MGNFACTHSSLSCIRVMDIHVLGDTASQAAVQELLECSCEIFEIDPNATELEPPADINEWMMRITEKKGEIVYHKDNSSDKITALVVTFRRSPDPTQLHIWIAGCKSAHRRKGIMNKLFEEIERRSVAQGYVMLTVNTYPEKFTNMPSFLDSRDYKVISTTPATDPHDDLGVKLGYSKSLPV